MPVIHFFHLLHLLRELGPGSTVRVEAAARHLVDPPRVAYEVYVRAATNAGEILSWMVRTGESPARPESAGAVSDAHVAEGEAEADRVRQFVAEQGYNVQRGLIDLRGAQPIAGAWRAAGHAPQIGG